ncbi:MAG: DUF2304 domain-containing protein [Candidatus Omnitrophica bacterium]|nr:DUF2304 domain-containing protein [Candidatus Omnitrophota bacterium]
MTYILQISLIGVLFIFLIYLLRLILHKKFRERDAFSWLCLIFFFIVMILNYKNIDKVAAWFGIVHSFALVFVLGIFFILIIIFYQSYKISCFTNNIIELTQRVALLEYLLQEKEKKQNENNTNKSTGDK